jgi:hypothetical protein
MISEQVLDCRLERGGKAVSTASTPRRPCPRLAGIVTPATGAEALRVVAGIGVQHAAGTSQAGTARETA